MKSKELVARLKEVLTEGAWVTGSNFKAEIKDLDWKIAIQNYENLNSIAAITYHVNYYIAGVLEVLEGGILTIRDKFSFDAPEIKNDEDWQIRIKKFIKDSERFINTIGNQTDEELEEIFVDPKYGSLELNINVLIEHTYYHLGQIVLIKKLLNKKGASN